MIALTEIRQVPAALRPVGGNHWISVRSAARKMEYRLLLAPAVLHMLDREKVVAVLKRRFPGSTPQQVAAAANALVGLEDEWMEISLVVDSEICRHECYLKQVLHGREIRVFGRAHHHEESSS